MTQASRRGIPFVVAAPSGTGKTTVCHKVIAIDPLVDFSVSHTTRVARESERDGVDYHFVTAGDFRRLNEQGAFLEHAAFSGNNYGTSYEALRVPLEEKGHDVVLEIEVQGAEQIRERRGDAKFIFLLPPSLAVLEQRLRGRGTDSDEAIDRRLGVADRELEAIRFFDYAVVNDELDAAVRAILEIIAAERSGKPEGLARARRLYLRETVYRDWCERNGAPAA